MTAFTLLTFEAQLGITGLLFVAGICLLELCLYKYISASKFRHALPDAICFSLSLVLVAALRASFNKGETVFEIRIPYIVLVLTAAVMLIYFVFGMLRQRRQNREQISPASVRQALDNLESGICFADTEGRIILINRTMGGLISGISGAYPQTLGEIDAALESVGADGDGFYDVGGAIWRFHSDTLSGKGVNGYTQVTAQDITELYNANEKLRQNNERLRQTNEKTQLMYESLADRIREQETLNLKIRVHNDIGRSLIELSEIIEGKTEADTEAQLAALQNAVGYFSDSGGASLDSFEKSQERARRMNVELIVNGVRPAGRHETELIVTACDECVTNCKTHADGKTVFAEITDKGDAHCVRITNDGAVPTGKVREGGGLTSLRRKIEAAGGTMTVLHEPEFALIITIPKGDA